MVPISRVRGGVRSGHLTMMGRCSHIAGLPCVMYNAPRQRAGEAMKGLAHFVSGIAIASFVPEAIRQSAEGGFPLLLAGLGALLPDALDFRLARFLEIPDLELDVDAEQPDPQMMAEQISAAIARANKESRRIVLRLPVARTEEGLWRRYTVYLGTEVRVSIGPLVSTSGVAARATAVDGAEGAVAMARPVLADYGPATQVDAFAGPTIAFERIDCGARAIFLPWHRVWSHSLLLAAAFSAVVALLTRPLYGMLLGIGAGSHIVADQLGHMGSNLWWPVTRQRTRGSGLFHSGDVLPNLLTVALGVLVVARNLDRGSAHPVLRLLAGLGAVVALMWAILAGICRWQRRRRPPEAAGLQPIPVEDVLAEDGMERG
jgi:hypothetical protein